ncbi:SecY-interacting protein [Shewanella schlegeliana]|uniref:Protein Syd n=1 Tax=Shewanella schlegeliana TaxID=190308 RepID=A0ABS1SYN6_9GAMM|nr:SecY-interacting protein [Shewanella schlegeliana]MBL4913450.1 SecY-interacting protein [Shewanella schlegeliana]MCL1108340.1 SecY-interacting protein [Shewanella schlegeliana]
MSSLPALDLFLSKYQQAYVEQLGEQPRYYAQEQESDCVVGEMDSDGAVFWQAVVRQEAGQFDNVETALELTLSAEINAFYGRHFSAPLFFDSKWGSGELIQVWNQTDFEYLQQNIIGHLMMKKKLKQEPTWFIGVLDDEDKMLTVNNADGSVWVEIPGETQSTKLTESLDEFIGLLTPRVTPPVKPIEESMPELDHPGIWQRMKLMWRNLRGK